MRVRVRVRARVRVRVRVRVGVRTAHVAAEVCTQARVDLEDADLAARPHLAGSEWYVSQLVRE